MRRALAAGAGLGDILDDHGLEIALDRLLPFARWHPAHLEQARRVFDTRFYIARAPDGQVASVDATENVALFWSSAADMLGSEEHKSELKTLMSISYAVFYLEKKHTATSIKSS